MRLFGAEERYDSGTHLTMAEDRLFHHEGRQLADGRVFNLERVTLEGSDRQFGFRVQLVNPATSTVDFDYHSQRAVDEGHLPRGTGNAWHANWATITELNGDPVLLVSLCFIQRIVAIDIPTGDWRWTFGADGDFALMDENGTPLSNDHYPQCQHGVHVDGNRLLVYDNGVDRGFSRIAEYEIDEATMTAHLDWTWTEDDWFESTFGSVKRLPDARILIGMGHNECVTDHTDDQTTLVELSADRTRTLWRARYPDKEDTTFRANTADGCALFANARYCPAIADRVAQLFGDSVP